MAVRMAHRPTGWRTVFVSPTLLMLPGVILMMALRRVFGRIRRLAQDRHLLARPGRIPVHPMRELCVRRSAAPRVRRLEGEARA